MTYVSRQFFNRTKRTIYQGLQKDRSRTEGSAPGLWRDSTGGNFPCRIQASFRETIHQLLLSVHPNPNIPAHYRKYLTFQTAADFQEISLTTSPYNKRLVGKVIILDSAPSHMHSEEQVLQLLIVRPTLIVQGM